MRGRAVAARTLWASRRLDVRRRSLEAVVSDSALGTSFIVLITFASLGFVVFSMVRTIRDQHTKGRSIWKQFGLGLALMILFFATWIGHGIAEWQRYTDEQRSHGEPVTTGDFFGQFAASTLENWQSEFLQLFAFVSLAGLYIFKGSAESKDTDEKIEASLRRIEAKLDTLPAEAPTGESDEWKLPHPDQEGVGS
jgi:hypothetical protein